MYIKLIIKFWTNKKGCLCVLKQRLSTKKMGWNHYHHGWLSHGSLWWSIAPFGFLTKQIRDKQSKINFFFDRGLYWRQVFSCGHQRLLPYTIIILLNIKHSTFNKFCRLRLQHLTTYCKERTFLLCIDLQFKYIDRKF